MNPRLQYERVCTLFFFALFFFLPRLCGPHESRKQEIFLVSKSFGGSRAPLVLYRTLIEEETSSTSPTSPGMPGPWPLHSAPKFMRRKRYY